MLKEKNLKSTVIANEVKQSHQIATPCGLAMTEQSGRSMVEMLGVLAVIGILSVAGVAGYTTAMNRYRANELLNEASKRAAIVAMQIASGKSGEALSITEFTQPSGYLFGVNKSYATGEKVFKLTLSKESNEKIDEAICSQMKATTGTNSAMQVNNDCSEITFSTDLSKGVSSDSTNTGGCQDGVCNCSGNQYNDGSHCMDCPGGYTVSQDGTTCCDTKKTGYDMNSNQNTSCGCPYDSYNNASGTSTHDSASGNNICCYDNYEWDENNNAYSKVNVACGCPYDNNSYTPGTSTYDSVADKNICCANNYEWDEGLNSYSKVNLACGCPSDSSSGTSVTPTYDSEAGENICCYNGYEWDGSNNSYSKVNLACGCPYNYSSATPGTSTYDSVAGKYICCANNYEWDGSNNSYSKVNFACGCPSDTNGYSGTTVYDSVAGKNICCRYGYEWDENNSNYSKTNEACNNS